MGVQMYEASMPRRVAFYSVLDVLQLQLNLYESARSY